MNKISLPRSRYWPLLLTLYCAWLAALTLQSRVSALPIAPIAAGAMAFLFVGRVRDLAYGFPNALVIAKLAAFCLFGVVILTSAIGAPIAGFLVSFMILANLGIPPTDYLHFLWLHKASPPDWVEDMLGSAVNDEVKQGGITNELKALGLSHKPETDAALTAAYRAIVRECHPDKFHHQGEVAVNEARARLQRANEAYERLRNREIVE